MSRIISILTKYANPDLISTALTPFWEHTTKLTTLISIPYPHFPGTQTTKSVFNLFELCHSLINPEKRQHPSTYSQDILASSPAVSISFNSFYPFKYANLNNIYRVGLHAKLSCLSSSLQDELMRVCALFSFLSPPSLWLIKLSHVRIALILYIHRHCQNMHLFFLSVIWDNLIKRIWFCDPEKKIKNLHNWWWKAMAGILRCMQGSFLPSGWLYSFLFYIFLNLFIFFVRSFF